MKKILSVIGARPQFIKHAPVEIALKRYFDVVSIHTGQHYDARMSQIFFNQLRIEPPKYSLSIGSYSHGKQTGLMLEKIEEVLLFEKPDGVLVYGDTNSTLAGALAASKLNIPIIHVEAGLRSFNRGMPEEINRVITDHLSSILFSPTLSAVKNLDSEGIHCKVFATGDVMYDAVLLAKRVLEKEEIVQKNQLLVTLHRPYNTDNIVRLKTILNAVNELNLEIIFPIHPRTSAIMDNHGVSVAEFKNIAFCDPVSYFDSIRLQMESSCIITDSGGIQKEAYMLKKKCITLRSETEWTETLANNWNTLVFDDLHLLKEKLIEVPGPYVENLYGTGTAADEIADILKEHYYQN